jgi:hypothetical protein
MHRLRYTRCIKTYAPGQLVDPIFFLLLSNPIALCDGLAHQRPAPRWHTKNTSPQKQGRNHQGDLVILAEAITAHGYSQMEVAAFLGLYYSTISRILAANRPQI